MPTERLDDSYKPKPEGLTDRLRRISLRAAVGWTAFAAANLAVGYYTYIPGIVSVVEQGAAELTDMSPRERAIADATNKATGEGIKVACVGPIMDRLMHMQGTWGAVPVDKDGDTISGVAQLRRDVCSYVLAFRDGENSFEAYKGALVPLHEAAHSGGIDDESDADCAALDDYLAFSRSIGRTARIDPGVWAEVEEDTRDHHHEYYDRTCFDRFAVSLESQAA
jgi:hypothetical protein